VVQKRMAVGRSRLPSGTFAVDQTSRPPKVPLGKRDLPRAIRRTPFLNHATGMMECRNDGRAWELVIVSCMLTGVLIRCAGRCLV